MYRQRFPPLAVCFTPPLHCSCLLTSYACNLRYFLLNPKLNPPPFFNSQPSIALRRDERKQRRDSDAGSREGRVHSGPNAADRLEPIGDECAE